MVFFNQLLGDGEIDPNSGDKLLQEGGGELLDNASQFTTKTINNTEDHDISENLANWGTNEEPPEAIA